jgi:hypothetical protein
MCNNPDALHALMLHRITREVNCTDVVTITQGGSTNETNLDKASTPKWPKATMPKVYRGGDGDKGMHVGGTWSHGRSKGAPSYYIVTCFTERPNGSNSKEQELSMVIC